MSTPPPPIDSSAPPAAGFAPPGEVYQAPGVPAPYGYSGLPQPAAPQGGPQAVPAPGSVPPNPYAQHAPYAQGNPYAQASPYPQGHQNGWPATDEQGNLRCRCCGSVPAAEATFRGHQGMVVVMRFLSRRGPFCRDCGIATHRQMTADSMWQGWWGLFSSVVNPFTMLRNLPHRARINKLPPPQPGGPRRPMAPGRPIFLRPAALGLLAPILVIGLIVWSAQSDPDYAKVGDCVQNQSGAVTAGVADDHPDVRVVGCSDPAAQARVVGKLDSGSWGGSPDDACHQFPDADGYYRKQGSDGYLLCLHFLKP